MTTSLASTTMAFTPPSTLSRPRTMPLHATLTADELSTMDKDAQLKVLGVEEEKLALGIDVDEILEFIGTRDDLVEKFQTDIPKFSPSEIETEVDKFLMDGEQLDLYIKYSQRKREDPNWEPQYAPERTPVQKVVGFVSEYGIYVIFGILFKDTVTNYMDTHGGLPDWVPSFGVGGGGGEAADVLVSSALDGIHHLSNTLM
eukprot:CAMPEP_0172306982 /NCGR_PEP_ID=MMETSP1058-20130122/7932_1 /TAXON_ID=83371 /ORGANISM="Detonula confervacea, Strain CCMP 353" /LENGTH=200 /DNA_ID=CAMNT_0013019037 /DNA_START=151 /DNA_END=753 /DNA_ORIENTATION=+